jgi:glycosyltransferase involved in cell wall biosynthesis
MPAPLPPSSVSVVVPAYNAAPFLRAALDSVLAQTEPVAEVLVVDDGSTDATAEIAAGYAAPVRLLRQENAGVSAARNHGIREARGEWIAFLDADDTWLPAKNAVQLAALRAAPEHGVCYSAFQVVDEDLRPLRIERNRRRGTILEDLLQRGNVVGSVCTVLVRRSLLDEVGGFDPAFSYCADWELWVRLARRTEFLYLDEPLVTYRRHAGMMSRGVERLQDDSVRLLEGALAHPDTPAALRRRRAAILGRNWMVLAGSYLEVGNPLAAVRCAGRAILLDPAQMLRPLGLPFRRLRRRAGLGGR